MHTYQWIHCLWRVYHVTCMPLSRYVYSQENGHTLPPLLHHPLQCLLYSNLCSWNLQPMRGATCLKPNNLPSTFPSTGDQRNSQGRNNRKWYWTLSLLETQITLLQFNISRIDPLTHSICAVETRRDVNMAPDVWGNHVPRRGPSFRSYEGRKDRWQV